MSSVAFKKLEAFFAKAENWAISTLPTPLRFLAVGGTGLTVDMASFINFENMGFNYLVARAMSLALATLVTWRLNRALTFSQTGRRTHQEAMRYMIVTAVAQSTSYTIFAILAYTVFQAMPVAAIFIGAVAATLVSYNGHRLFSFSRTSSGSPRPNII